MEKALKSPRAGVVFFLNCKKPGRGSKTRSDGFVQSICNQYAFSSSRQTLAPLSGCRGALSVSQTLPSGMFILRASSRRLIPATSRSESAPSSMRDLSARLKRGLSRPCTFWRCYFVARIKRLFPIRRIAPESFLIVGWRMIRP